MIEHIKNRIRESIQVKQAFTEELHRNILKASELVIRAYKNQHKAIFMGNGGSAGDAQHLAAELVGRYYKDRPPLPALALNANTSSLTAISNDYSYSQSFLRQIEAFTNPGDVVIAISTSGNSENVVLALESARKKGAGTIALTGKTGGRLRAHADILLNVPSEEVPRIQETHILIGHIICELVESEMFS